MNIGGRPLRVVLGAPFRARHIMALVNVFRVFPRPWRELWRYLSASGRYPYDCTVRTPSGRRTLTLDSHHDLLTVNEVFCRLDYQSPRGIRAVVDIGSNIGVSALYFLTRNPNVRCWLFEPNPRNLDRLRGNLSGFEDRYLLDSRAVSDVAGPVRFGIEPTGRYGGIDVETGTAIEVDCLAINDVLERVLLEVTRIDVVKIDTEGAEARTVRAIKADLLATLRRIYLETATPEPFNPILFEQSRRGLCTRLDVIPRRP
jgi:FkbM family methyltransferase